MLEVALGKVSFAYQCRLPFGQSLVLVGNSQALGRWLPTEGVPLVTNPQSYPMWTTATPIELPIGETIEYKYALRVKGEFVWEKLKGNRQLHVIGKNMTIEDSEEGNLSKVFVKSSFATKSDFSARIIRQSSKLSLNAELFTLADSIIIATMLLPVSVHLNPNYQEGSSREEKWQFGDINGSWLPVLYDITVREGMQVKWVGALNIEISEEEDQELLAEIMKKRFNCYPVFLPGKLMTDHKKYCEGTLFPIFHNVINIDPELLPAHSLEVWDAYRLVNSRFSDKITEIHTFRELIWVNDYQLLLTPSFLSRRAREPLNIGLYLHTPFPSSEIFRTIPHRDALLHAMLCCDLIGFHIFEHARHFVACCKRLLGVEHKCSRGGFLGLEFYGRYIMLRVGHLGVEPQLLRLKGKTPAAQAAYTRLSSQYKDKTLILGIDPLSRLSGITLKMNAFKELMSDLPEDFQQRVVLLQVLTPSTGTTAEISTIRQELFALNAAITKEIGREIIQLEERDLSREEQLAYLKAASAIVITTVRDGLNILPFEFVVVKESDPGLVILSEFAGVSQALCCPYRVNPFDISALKEALFNAIRRTDIPCRSPNQEKDYSYALTHTTFRWMEAFLSDLKKARKQEKRFQYVVHGFGDRLKLVALRKRLTYLIGEDLLIDYKKARCRAFFFDSEGTLSSTLKAPDPLQTSKFEKNLLILEELSKDERNNVFVISGQERGLLEAYYRPVSHLGIAAEHGAFIKMSNQSHWELIPAIHNRWKDTAIDIISGYVTRTEGSYCEEKETSVVFQYRNADPEYGDWQAKELTTQLDIIMKPYLDECEVCAGNGYVEVKPRGINKGTALRLLAKRVAEKMGEIDFIMAVGDDVNDEDMFHEIKDLKSEQSAVLAATGVKIVTCTIGKKPSRAKFYINDSSDLTHILDLLRNSSVKVIITSDWQVLFPN